MIEQIEFKLLSPKMINKMSAAEITRADLYDNDGFPIESGPMDPKQFMNQSSIRELANDTFLNDSLTQGTDLQERLMRKSNARAWQQRKFPIHKRGMLFCK